MHNLFSANLLRLRKSRLFWGTLAVVLAVSVASMLLNTRDAMRYAQLVEVGGMALDDVFFGLLPALGLVFAAFLSLFLGTDYSDGTVRNRLLVGHSRGAVYFSNLLTSLVACLAVAAAWLLGALTGIPGIGPWQSGTKVLLENLLVILGVVISLAALCNFLGNLCTRKAAGAVLALLVFLAMLIFSSFLYNSLAEPEIASEMRITANGIEVGDPFPNPGYVAEPLRSVYNALLVLLPTGQSILLVNQELWHPAAQFACSLAVACAVSAIGALLFRKKDLK